MLAAALGLLWFAEPRERLPAWQWYAVSALVIGLGSLTKAQFVVFLPAFLLLVLDHRREGARELVARRQPSRPWESPPPSPCASIAWHGDYTEGFGLSNVPDQLGSKYLWLVAAFALAWTVYAVVRRETLLRDLIPTAVFLAFVVVFAQWPGGFLWTLLGFVAAGAFALAVSRLRSPALATTAVVASLVWACTWIVVRTDELYSSLTSIGEFARSAPARSLAADGDSRLHLLRGRLGRHRRLRAPRAGPAAQRSPSARPRRGRPRRDWSRRRASATRSSTRAYVPRLSTGRSGAPCGRRAATGASSSTSPRPKTTGNASTSTANT